MAQVGQSVPWFRRVPPLELTPSDTPSPTSGGTAKILLAERAKASFSSQKLEEFLGGGKEIYAEQKRWKKIWEDNPLFDQKDDHFLSRQEQFERAIARGLESYRILRANPDILREHMPGGRGVGIGSLSGSYSGIADHFALFVGTIMFQGTAEQGAEWLQPSLKLKILGTYGQTELGHGSNVRGLETTAEYDKKTEEFIINSPTLTSLKWWPGALGVIATHAIMYARLIIDGKDYGFHSFVVQLRDENHKPLPGVAVGDIGPKMGYAANDSGFCALRNVRIPRFNLLAKYQQVTPDGKYVKPPGGLSKIGYLTMTRTRVTIVLGAYKALAKGVTIAIRYNAVRKQGFMDAKQGIASGETCILDYQNQQFTLFTQLATAFAIYFASYSLYRVMGEFESALRRDAGKVDASILPEIHATSAGLKAYTTIYVADGLESLRRCLGGQGYALSSGLAALLLEFVPAVTYEGDRIPMALQTARFLVKSARAAEEGKPLSGNASYLRDPAPEKSELTSSSDFRNITKLADVFKHLAKRSVFRAANELAARVKKEGYDQAWNHSQKLLLRAAENHCLYILLKSFIDGISHVKKQDLAASVVLERLCALFALYRIYNPSSVEDWTGYFSSEQAVTVLDVLNSLLLEIRPDAVALVDSFGFTDRDLETVIGKYDGNVYEEVYAWARKSPLNDPEWQHGLWERQLKPFLDREYLAKSKGKMRSHL